MKTLLLAGTAALLLAFATPAAQAAVAIDSLAGGAPIGNVYDNLDNLTLTGPPLYAPANQVTATGIKVTLSPDARVVQGSASGLYAAPFLSGNNGNNFGNPSGNQALGQDATTYITSGSTGSAGAAKVTLDFSVSQTYLGVLWGSIDAYNTLKFYDNGTLVATITGSQVSATPNGSQNADGTRYVNFTFNGGDKFDTVEFISSQYAFEFDNIAYNREIPVPEPATLGLLGASLIGLGIAARRRRKA